MRKIIYTCVLILIASLSWSQPYGNEWINYNNKYLKFKIASEGVYRISYNTLNSALQQAGIFLSSIDHRNFQLFTRGEEQHIYIKAALSGQFTQGDYIEFYANKNDGWLDKQLYLSPAGQANPDYSLFNDTAT